MTFTLVFWKVERDTGIADNPNNFPEFEYGYDAMGQRVVEIRKPWRGGGQLDTNGYTYTYYIRDATGNILATYERKLQGPGPNRPIDTLFNKINQYGGDSAWKTFTSKSMKDYPWYLDSLLSKVIDSSALLEQVIFTPDLVASYTQWDPSLRPIITGGFTDNELGEAALEANRTFVCNDVMGLTPTQYDPVLDSLIFGSE